MSSPASFEFASCFAGLLYCHNRQKMSWQFRRPARICWHYMTSYFHISPRSLVTSGAFQTRQSVEVSATRCWVGGPSSRAWSEQQSHAPFHVWQPEILKSRDGYVWCLSFWLQRDGTFLRMVRISLVCWLSPHTCISFIRSKFRSVFFVPLSLDHFGLFVLDGVSDCKSSLLCLMDPYGASSCPFSYSSFFLPHHFRMESVIHNIDHKTQIRWFKWDIYFQFQSISKPSEAAAWCGKSPHHSNSWKTNDGSGIHFWMMPSQNLEVAWGRMSIHIWRKRWNENLGKSLELLMKHFLNWNFNHQLSNHFLSFSTIFYHCYPLLTFQVGPWPGRGASVRCFTSTTWTPLLSST